MPVNAKSRELFELPNQVVLRFDTSEGSFIQHGPSRKNPRPSVKLYVDSGSVAQRDADAAAKRIYGSRVVVTQNLVEISTERAMLTWESAYELASQFAGELTARLNAQQSSARGKGGKRGRDAQYVNTR